MILLYIDFSTLTAKFEQANFHLSLSLLFNIFSTLNIFSRLILYLSKLKIFGFKSFAQKVEVHFPGNGITAVVGPNGCGKSNIIDAIRWVLGEQRAKQLRSSKMEDVIFSGTADRPPMNLAEVSILINNDRGVLPSEYTEIQITRRALRNGESEYLINGQECRLKDIHNLFMDTGMGAASYSIMEQRMIDTILSTKADERRTLFEETAGISKYKQQRKETLKQLERTALDLDRVNDSLQNAKRNVSHFERQAKKAEEWRRIKKLIRELDLSLSAIEYAQTHEKLSTIVNHLRQNEYDLEKCRNQLSFLETQIEEKKLLIAGEESAYREQEQMVIQLNLDSNSLEGEVQRSLDKIQSLNQLHSRMSDESDLLWSKLENAHSELNIAKHELEKTQLLKDNPEERLSQLEEERLQTQNKLDDARAEQMELTQERMESVQKIADLRQELNSYVQKLDFERKQHAQFEQKKLDLEDKISPLREELLELEGEIAQFVNEHREVSEKNLILRRTIEDLNERVIQKRSAWQNLDREYAQSKSQADMLADLLKNPQEGLSPISLKMMEKNTQFKVLQDLIQVKPGFEDMVEWVLSEKATTLLHPELNHTQIAEEIALLAQGKTWIYNAAWPETPLSIQDARIQCSLASQIESENPFLQNLIKALFQNTYLVEQASDAYDLSLEYAHTQAQFYTPTGEIFLSNGLQWRGEGEQQSQANSSLFKRRNQYEEILSSLGQKEAEVNTLKEELNELNSRLSEEKYNLGEQEILEKNLSSQIQKLQPELSRKRAQFESFEDQLEMLKTQNPGILSSEDRTPFIEKNLENAEEERALIEERYKVSLNKRQEYESILSEINHQIQNLHTSQLASVQAINTLKNKVEWLQNQIVEWNGARTRRLEEIQENLEAQEQAQVAIQNLNKKLEMIHERLSLEENKRDVLKEIYEEKQSILEETRLQIREMNTGIQEHTESLHQNQIRKQTLTDKHDRLRERIFEQHEIDLETDEFETVKTDAHESPQELIHLMQELKDLGNVNPSALEDYEEEKKRLDEVEKQFDDLDRARISLEKTIRKLDLVAKERFLTTFTQIQKNFQDVFSSLMKDGEAKLTLQEGVDPLEADIEINARPTGKKMRGVQLLSGGERALTAVSLLFALYMIKPSPYCILDEVDGPLDDANIGRFVQLLRRFSRQTQFIVVTHNKRTMAGADRLYGVTQEIKGISKTAAVNLDEAAGMVH